LVIRRERSIVFSFCGIKTSTGLDLYHRPPSFDLAAVFLVLMVKCPSQGRFFIPDNEEMTDEKKEAGVEQKWN
jgi:hypothetical protein